MELRTAGTDPRPDLINVIFFNPRGLRAGWRLAIFLVLGLPIWFFFSSWLSLARYYAPALANSPLRPLQNDVVIFFTVVAATWIMGRIEGRNAGEYGLPLRKGAALSRFAAGYVLWGFLPLSVLLLALRGLGVFDFGEAVLHGTDILYWGALWALAFLFVGLAEEYLMRGYALHTLADGIGFWPAAIVLATLFALGHTGNPGETRLGIVMTAVFAMFASITLRRTGNLWLAVGAHAGWDWGQSYFYGVSDSGIVVPGHLFEPRIQGPGWLSGGTVGPEGSALVLVLLVTMSVLFMVLYPNPDVKPAENQIVQG
jgi:hypothetical protein